MSPRAIVCFDLDGTLVDSAGDIARALNAALHERALAPFSVEHVRGFIGSGARKLCAQALAARGAPHPDDDETLLARFRAHYETQLVGDTTVFAGLPAALTQIARHATLVVATNKPGAFARPIVQRLLPDRFALVLGPDDVGAAKPDPRMLHALGERLGGVVAVHVGDTPIDVQAGMRAAIPVVGVTWGSAARAQLVGAHAVVDTPAELPDVVQGLLSAAR